MILAVRPTPEEVRTRLGVPVETVPDDELADVLAGEIDGQDEDCRTEPYPASLRLALFRRCARSLAAKGVPLGILMDEFGSTSLRANDAEIFRLEGKWLRFALGGEST
jgi:hypothetical protein